MIFDKIENLKRYKGFEKVAEFINKEKPFEKEIGKYPVNDDFYYSISEYDTKVYEDMQLEKHDKYIDIQIILEGEEYMYFKDISFGEKAKDYDEAKDMSYFRTKNPDTLLVPAGYFAIFYPNDIHRPNCVVDTPKHVRKCLFKVKVK